ncbi:MAG: ribonuclease H-like domain-containing protein [Roseburia sp.]
MKIWHEEIDFSNCSPLVDSIFTESSIFFDIETTGFSPSNSSLYLIGCASRKGNVLSIQQFFAETPTEEADVLTTFLDYLSSYHTILSFNGLGFDIPYLKGKCLMHQINDPFSQYEYFDIFKEVTRLKFLLKLPSYKQKSIEQFLGIERDDQFDGGQLISVYQDYVKTKDSDAEHLLKLHNYEDVIGMIDLLPVLSYCYFLKGCYSLESVKMQTYENYNHTETGKELFFSFTLSYPVPKRVSYRFADCYLSLYQSTATISVKVLEAELKFFFPNYKDYYYLPQEDKAIHKSVASYVEKEFREKAKASNCYQKKEGHFLPQYEEVVSPAFRKELKDKVTYFELTDEFFQSKTLPQNYVDHLIHIFSLQKK